MGHNERVGDDMYNPDCNTLGMILIQQLATLAMMLDSHVFTLARM
ncbi:hypothetical protein BTN49_2299 (plasmid) [Candidatus Enterovibrio escicola]|uniref:Uncharacterized protein n=1 Tax=Candidatus Enterovibrio escicola TaxID=1927127 RepID=A0A2A5T1S9_9GAMM|nr:hypothetical protein BTN49_2299 [Candidatus Enterovibrio escacola]